MLGIKCQDRQKAFDKIDHVILCQTFKNIGVCGKLGEWIPNFLSNRFQRIKTWGVFSKGTGLGLILFLVSINDINLNIDSKVSSFADGIRMCDRSTSTANALKIQQDCIYR